MMMRTGVVGLVFGLLTLAIGGSGSWLLHRWLRRHVAFFVSYRRLTLGALLGIVLLAPLGRWLVNAGLDDRFFWMEAVGQLWGMSLLVSVPALHARDWLVSRASRRAAAPVDAPPDPSRREALVGGAFVGASLAPLLWGVRTRFDAELVELPIRIARLPKQLDGFSIVQVSDIHIGAFLGEHELRDAADRVAGLKPDLVVMTGDLVHLRPSYLPMGCDWVRRLGERSRFGVLSILGNHEYYTGRAAVLEAFDRAKLEMLVNRSRTIAPKEAGGIVIAGVDDLAAKNKGYGPDLDAALEGVPADAPKILLCHQPQFHPFAAAKRVDLQLSGHTHGGQIAPYGPMVARAMFGAYKGLYRIGASSLYVNRGFGTSGPPSRVAVRSEITKIILVAG